MNKLDIKLNQCRNIAVDYWPISESGATTDPTVAVF